MESKVLEKCWLFLAMENCYCAGPQGATWAPYNSAALSNESSSFPLPWPPHASSSAQFQFCGFPNSWSAAAEGADEEDRAATASKSHSQAEKRRRDRINAQLATLRKLIPKSDKVLSTISLNNSRFSRIDCLTTYHIDVSTDGQGGSVGKCDRSCEGSKAKSNGSQQSLHGSN